jgi:hypothetical protein
MRVDVERAAAGQDSNSRPLAERQGAILHSTSQYTTGVKPGLTSTEEYRLVLSGKYVLGGIFGPKTDEIRGWRELHN